MNHDQERSAIIRSAIASGISILVMTAMMLFLRSRLSAPWNTILLIAVILELSSAIPIALKTKARLEELED